MTMKKTTKKQRLFFALAPQQPADSVTALHQLTCQIDQAVPIDNLHVTLAFLGMVTPAQTEAIVQAIDNHPPTGAFSATFNTLGYWRRSKVLWLGCPQPPAPLQDLVDHLYTVLAPCGIVREPRPYAPHITLAKAIKQRPTALLDTLTPPSLTFHFPAFGLYISTTEHAQLPSQPHAQHSVQSGVRYRCLAQWLL
ncbi:RNA 2',3'-cyclic phosphodiesterase [Photobacterium aphoticum]|uniref:RNA 2',3'-cyclic phosphodiesterase n=1 Tax=Photobacterium aphoticum TaxID=754436 RepID=UPI00069D895D|nr:RNA 2',3'-cyclic phosphodiesterase [Photobacterium aphoticum]PSU56438.1 RNA 2',3'-cyclic phosphodiesterase [Photobacterium aphoticum]GHA53759.1 RNA 2',3'-cyclic phosphodiesterase [Photobacterium aphoticum]